MIDTGKLKINFSIQFELIVNFYYSCPVDTYVFPELGRSRDGDSLEARFNAFKIPESNFLVFEATVRTCKDGCQPAYCNGINGRSFGRKRRSINETILNSEEFIEVNDTDTKHFPKVTTVIQHASNDNGNLNFLQYS